MVIQELVTLLGFKVDSKELKELNESIHSLREGLLGLTVELGGAAGALYEVVKGTAEAAFQIKNQALSLGISTESYSRLTFAAKESGVAQEDLSMALVLLNRRMEEARMGSSEAVISLRQMGLPLQSIMNGSLRTDQALGIISKRFQAMKGDARLTGQALELFGRSGARMIPFLTQGGAAIAKLGKESDELGMTVTEADAAMSQGFIISLERVKDYFVGLKREIGFGLMPAFKDIIDSTFTWLKANRDVVKSNLGGFVKGLAGFLKAAMGPLREVANSAMGYIKLFGGAETATKGFLIAMTALSGATVLFGLGKLIMALRTIAGSMALLDLLGGIVPILWGTLFVGLGLILDDIIGYFQGKSSVTEIIIQAVDKLAVGLEARYPRVMKFFKDLAYWAGKAWDFSKFISNGLANTGNQKYERPPSQRLLEMIAPKVVPSPILMGPPTSLAGAGKQHIQVEQHITNHFPAGTSGQMSDRVQHSAKEGTRSGLLDAARQLNQNGAAN